MNTKAAPKAPAKAEPCPSLWDFYCAQILAGMLASGRHNAESSIDAAITATDKLMARLAVKGS